MGIRKQSSADQQRLPALLALLLAGAAAVVYARACGNGFVNYDDPRYVTENAAVRSGLSASGLRWALTTTDVSNWHPLTWLSLQLDATLYGLNPRGFHLTSVLLHAANSALVFLLFARLTAAPWRSALLGGLFALHPLRVESVAWVSERKDVLCALFGVLALYSYARYAAAPRPAAYLSTGAALACGLAAKPMLVTLPAVFLLLDFWPLGRLGASGAEERPASSAQRRIRSTWGPGARLLLEKTPLFLLVCASALATIVAQREGGALKSLRQFPLEQRAANAAWSCLGYIGTIVWPVGLTAFYPYPENSGLAVRGLLAAGAVVAVSVLAWALRRRLPYLFVGWFWYLGMLVPVIGLIQVGVQAMADRYTYLPSIGLLLILVWGAIDLLAARGWTLAVPAGAAAAVLAACAVMTWFQLGTWKDSFALWQHALEVTANNPVAHQSLGVAYGEQNQLDKAIAQYQSAIRAKPDYTEAHFNLGEALQRQGKLAEAAAAYQTAINIDPRYMKAWANLGSILEILGRPDDAMRYYEKARQLQPGDFLVHCAMGQLFSRQGRHAEAEQEFRQATRLKPDFGPAYAGVASALIAQGRGREAEPYLEKARSLGWRPAAARLGRSAMSTRRFPASQDPSAVRGWLATPTGIYRRLIVQRHSSVALVTAE
jgi:tetratricopeptide (TPR) repeat protein